MSIIALAYISATPFLTKRYAAKWCYYTWFIIVLGYTIPVRPHFSFTYIKIPSSTLSRLQHNILDRIGSVATSGSHNEMGHQVRSGISPYQIIGILWLVGVIVFMAYHIIRHHRFLIMVRRWGEEVTDSLTLDLLKQIQVKLKVSGPTKLKICSFISSPMMIGFFRPVILLPSEALTTYELDFILKHELVHYKRKDLWYKSLVLFTTAIHWFNPTVYIMAKEIAAQCEISCDAEVVKDKHIRVRQQYSNTIIGVIKNKSRMQTVFSSYFYGGKKDLKKRIFSIMDTGRKKAGIVTLCLVVLGTLTVSSVFPATQTTTDNNNRHGVIIKSMTKSVSTIIDSDGIMQQHVEEKQMIINGN
jgi:beta-lactamase regulating signal transducer with metallopeptidase domain